MDCRAVAQPPLTCDSTENGSPTPIPELTKEKGGGKAATSPSRQPGLMSSGFSHSPQFQLKRSPVFFPSLL